MAEPISGHEHLVEHTEGSEGDTLVVSCNNVEYARKTFPPGFPSEAVEWWLRAVTAEHLAGPPLPPSLAWIADPQSPEMQLLGRVAAWSESPPGQTVSDEDMVEARRAVALARSLMPTSARTRRGRRSKSYGMPWSMSLVVTLPNE